MKLDTLEVCNPILDITRDFTIAFIAASIEKKISTSPSFYCSNCQTIFEENEKVNLPSNYLLDWIPTVSTHNICRMAERYFALIDIQNADSHKFNFRAIYCIIFRSMDFDNLFQKSIFECDITHKYQFIKCIVGEYTTIRATHASKKFIYYL